MFSLLKTLLFFTLFIFCAKNLFAQTNSTTTVSSDSALTSNKDEEKLIREFSFVPLPALAANPAVGVMFGLAPSANWMMGSESTTSRSSLVSSLIYTTKKQALVLIKSNVFLKNDSWNLMGDWRFFLFSQPTYGLGTGSQSSKLANSGFEYNDGSYSNGISDAQMMKFNFVRFHETFLKRMDETRFFLGLGYHLDHHYKIEDQLLNLDTVPPTLTSHYAYSQYKGFDPAGYTQSGISLNTLYDSRDNPINPYKGRYAFISYHINPEFLGSTQNSSTLWLEYRDYFSLSKNRARHLIGFWAFGNFVTSGNVPYLDLPAIGWDQFGKSGRAYPQGRWRGEDLTYAEVEYRFPLQKNKETFGGVVFANTTTASNREGDINLFQYIEPAAGLGLRVMIDKKAHTNITLDYGWGAYGAQGFYFNINETF